MSHSNLDFKSVPRIFFAGDFSSKKKSVQILAAILAEQSEHDIHDILEAFLNRERIGSTAIGCGVAIPHGRLEQSSRAMGVLIILDNGIDFGASDDVPVDIIFGLLVPEQGCEQHLSLLKGIATLASDVEALNTLRTEKSIDTLYQWIFNKDTQLGETLV